jgi:hypothetical protein
MFSGIDPLPRFIKNLRFAFVHKRLRRPFDSFGFHKLNMAKTTQNYTPLAARLVRFLCFRNPVFTAHNAIEHNKKKPPRK